MTMMIRPIPPRFYHFDFTDPMVTVSMIIVAIAAITAAGIVGACAAERFKGNKKQTVLCFIGIMTVVTALLCCFFGLAAVTVKGILFSLVLLFSSYQDIKTRECDDCLHLMIVTAAFIGTEVTALPAMILSGITVGGIILLAMLITKSNLGGADFKMASACAFLLGLRRGVTGLMAGLLLAVLVQTIRQKNKKEGFPMIPYLAAGFTAAYFI